MDGTSWFCGDAREHAQRLQRMLSAPLHGHRFGQASAIVRNISASGLGGTSRQWLIVGEGIEIELPTIGRVAGSVAWVRGMRFGMRFGAAIDPARVTRERSPGMVHKFQVMDRFRPPASPRRPPVGLR